MSDTYVNSSNLSRFWTNAKNYVDGQKDELFASVTQRYDGTQFVYTASHTFAQLKAALQAGKSVVVQFDGIKDATTTPTHYYRSLLQLEEEGTTVLIFYGMDAYNNYAYGIQLRIFDSNTVSAQYYTYIQPPSPVFTASDKSNLDAASYDTGWVDISSYILTNKVSVRDSMCHIRRTGNIIHLRVAVTITSSINKSTWMTFSNALPAQFRPKWEVFVSSYSQTPGFYIGVNADGTLKLRNQTGVDASSGWCYCMGSYLYDEPEGE